MLALNFADLLTGRTRSARRAGNALFVCGVAAVDLSSRGLSAGVAILFAGGEVGSLTARSQDALAVVDVADVTLLTNLIVGEDGGASEGGAQADALRQGATICSNIVFRAPTAGARMTQTVLTRVELETRIRRDEKGRRGKKSETDNKGS